MTVVHGDYRLGNTITAADGTIAAVLDWEICTLGDPLADLGYLLATWTEAGDPVTIASSPAASPGFASRVEMAGFYAARSDLDLSGPALLRGVQLLEGGLHQPGGVGPLRSRARHRRRGSTWPRSAPRWTAWPSCPSPLWTPVEHPVRPVRLPGSVRLGSERIAEPAGRRLLGDRRGRRVELHHLGRCRREPGGGGAPLPLGRWRSGRATPPPTTPSLASHRRHEGYSLAPSSLVAIPRGHPVGAALAERVRTVLRRARRRGRGAGRVSAQRLSRRRRRRWFPARPAVGVLAAGERWKGATGPMRVAIEDLVGAGAILAAVSGAARRRPPLAVAAFEVSVGGPARPRLRERKRPRADRARFGGM